MSKLRLWWCGWDVPSHIPMEAMAEKWPPGMKGWCTGSGGDDEDSYAVWTGAVWAEDGQSAFEIVRGCYGDFGGDIRSRWEPNAKDPSTPLSDRFPGGIPECPEVRS